MSRGPLRRFSFLGPTDADRLLARATSCKLELSRYSPDPASDDDGQLVAGDESESVVELHYQLSGEISLKGHDATELLVGLVRQFRQPRGKGGAQ